MSWIRDSSLTWAQFACVRILKCGVVPRHIAFIMDGNRRFAKKKKVQQLEGHTKGFDKLSETLMWCLDLGIPEVTVYAFSLENFKRKKEEVDSLMELVKQKLQRLLDEREKLMEHGVRIRIIGNRSAVPADIVKLIAEAELVTKDNNRAFLNVAFAYTARDEMTEATRQIIYGYEKGYLDEDDITTHLLSSCLYTGSFQEPELVIRTSGEKRLSDFLLWQSAFSYLYFTDVLWPEFTAWHLLAAVFHYQRAYSQLSEVKKKFDLASTNQMSTNATTFVSALEQNYWQTLRDTVAV